ncbi:MAG: hypothetical protein K6F93_03115 [Lachnospiraceae bacterium]|nr:hypothetical protein [Lachnospiraceae bacterium]
MEYSLNVGTFQPMQDDEMRMVDAGSIWGFISGVASVVGAALGFVALTVVDVTCCGFTIPASTFGKASCVSFGISGVAAIIDSFE